MAEYETICLDCEHVWNQSHSVHDDHAPCPKCGSKKISTYFGNGMKMQIAANSLDCGWEHENGGRGRYFSQLEDSVDCKPTNKNFFRSRNDAIEACKRRGFDILDK